MVSVWVSLYIIDLGVFMLKWQIPSACAGPGLGWGGRRERLLSLLGLHSLRSGEFQAENIYELFPILDQKLSSLLSPPVHDEWLGAPKLAITMNRSSQTVVISDSSSLQEEGPLCLPSERLTWQV